MVLNKHGRLPLPKEILEAMLSQGGMIMTLCPGRECIIIVPAEGFEKLKQALSKSPMKARLLQRSVIAPAVTVTPDNRGRITVPSHITAVFDLPAQVEFTNNPPESLARLLPNALTIYPV